MWIAPTYISELGEGVNTEYLNTLLIYYFPLETDILFPLS